MVKRAASSLAKRASSSSFAASSSSILAIICHGDAILYIRFYVYKAEIKEAAHRIEIRKHNSILEQPLFCLLSDFVGTKNFKYFIDMLLSHLRHAVARPFLHSLSHTTHRVQLNCKLNKYLSTWNSNSVKSVSPYEILGLPTTAQPQVHRHQIEEMETEMNY